MQIYYYFGGCLFGAWIAWLLLSERSWCYHDHNIYYKGKFYKVIMQDTPQRIVQNKELSTLSTALEIQRDTLDFYGYNTSNKPTIAVTMPEICPVCNQPKI